MASPHVLLQGLKLKLTGYCGCVQSAGSGDPDVAGGEDG